MAIIGGLDEFRRRAGDFRDLHVDAVRLTRAHDGVSADIELVMPPGVGMAWPERRADSETVFVFRFTRVMYFQWGGFQGADVVESVIDEIVTERKRLPGDRGECLSVRIDLRHVEMDMRVWCSSMDLIECVERPARHRCLAQAPTRVSMTQVTGMEEFAERAGDFRDLYVDAVRLTQDGNGLSAEIDIVMPPWIGPRHPDRHADSETVLIFRFSQINYFEWGGDEGVPLIDTPIDEVRIEIEYLPLERGECLDVKINSQSMEADVSVWCMSMAMIAVVERPAAKDRRRPSNLI